MDRILVSGLINVETTLRVDAFPLTYEPVRYPFFGVNSSVSGVGYNIAGALTTLGSEVDFLSIIGHDLAGTTVLLALAKDNLADQYILDSMPHTAQSVIIYDQTGRRQIHTDLKDIQDRHYPTHLFEQALQRCSLAVLCNINYNRPFLRQVQNAAIPLATDVHTIAAGDALFSSFVHTYQQTGDPYQSIRKVVVFASYKIGTAGAAEGFLTAAQLEDLYQVKKLEGEI